MVSRGLVRLAQIQQQEPGGLYQPPVTIRDLLAGNFFLGPAARRLATQHPACPSYLLALTQLAEPT